MIISNKAIRGVPVIVETMQPLISDAMLERLKGERHDGEGSNAALTQVIPLKSKAKK